MSENYSMKSTKTSMLLCICLAPLGIHRFYVGRIYSGLLMFIPGLAWYAWQMYKSINAITLLGLPEGVSITPQALLIGTTSGAPQGMLDVFMPWVGWAVIIWSLIDLLLIVFGKFTDSAGLPLKGYYRFGSK